MTVHRLVGPPPPPAAPVAGDLSAVLPASPGEASAARPVSALDGLIRAAVEASDVSFTIVDTRRPDQPLVYVNPAFERTTGFSRADSVGRNCRFLQGPGTSPEAIDAIRAAIAAARPIEIDVLNYRVTGEPFWNALCLTPLHDGAGRLAGYLGIQRDVTEIREREEEARRRDKMAALGRIAGQVAHELNNLLQPVLTLPDLVEEALPPEASAARGDLEMIRTSARDARSIVRRILDFGREPADGGGPAALAPALDAALASATCVLPPDVRLSARVDVGPILVALSATELRQVLINLIVNAADAMAGKGTVTVEARLLPPEPARTRAEASIVVRDTGPGVPAAFRDKVFEPFFSTKPVGAGTGLGLFVVAGIVRRAGGSAVLLDGGGAGRGAAFEIRLPAAAAPAASRTEMVHHG